MLCGQLHLLECFFITQPEIPVVGTEAPGVLESHMMCCLDLQLLLTQPTCVLCTYPWFWSHQNLCHNCCLFHDGRIIWGPLERKNNMWIQGLLEIAQNAKWHLNVDMSTYIFLEIIESQIHRIPGWKDHLVSFGFHPVSPVTYIPVFSLVSVAAFPLMNWVDQTHYKQGLCCPVLRAPGKISEGVELIN